MTYNIDDPKDLQKTFYQPGDHIILKNGIYDTDGRAVFMGSGTAENPIVFRAETPGGVIFTGGMQLNIGGETDDTTGEILATGEYLIVDGFHWKGGYGSSSVIEFRNSYDHARNSTIQNCVMDGLGVDINDTEIGVSEKHNWIQMYGYFNTVINCSFMNKVTSGNMILVDLAYNEWAPPHREPEEGEPDNGYQTVNTSCNTVGHTISNNYFYNYQKVNSSYENSGDSETIRIGTSSNQNIHSGTTVSNNYFVQADGENEIITNKSKYNKYINNTFRRSRGSLVLRHGSHATVEGNYFLGENVDGTGGIRIVDSNHTITNNYIQDCITIIDQAKWNNGITFMGGKAAAAVDCNSSSMSNGYQKSENINLSNNTIINTNAPLFYNVNTDHDNNVTGTISNNLIYFTPSYPAEKLTPVISGDTPTSYSDIGTNAALTYTGNVYTGTTLGATNTGFEEKTEIIANLIPNGDIFTFSGTGYEGKGADMGAYTPITDDMVGYGIGACFTNNLGVNIFDGDCSIEIPESIVISNLQPLSNAEANYDITVNANVGWTAVSNNDWITIDISAGTGDATISVSVTQNTETSSRVGSITFTQVAGGSDIVRNLTITQEGISLTDLYNLINTGESGDLVKVFSYSKQEDKEGKTNIATNTLDKNFNTVWAADDDSVPTGDYKSDGEYVIYNLNDEYKLDLIQIATDDKADPYGLQIWVSTTGTDPSDFTMVLPTSGDLLITTTTGIREAYDQYEVSTNARYVKLIVFGRFNGTADTRKSQWSNISEIEFYGTSTTLSTHDFSVNNIILFPNPVSNGLLYLNKQSIDFDELTIYNVSGKTILTKKLNSSLKKESIDISSISEGLYFVEVKKGSFRSVNKIVVSKQ